MTSRGPSRTYVADRWSSLGPAAVSPARVVHLDQAVEPRQGVPAGLTP